MDVLQRAFAVVWHVEAKVRLEARVPRLRQVFRFERALQHLVLELEAEQHVHVVSDLVGLHADQGRIRAVDRAVESLLVDPAQRLGEGRHEARKEMTPEGQAPPDQVFPEAGLRLVHARRRPTP